MGTRQSKWEAIEDRRTDHHILVRKLMDIRKDWTIADYEEWETDESIRFPSGMTLLQWRSHMEETLTNKYDPDYIQECIDNEKL